MIRQYNIDKEKRICGVRINCRLVHFNEPERSCGVHLKKEMLQVEWKKVIDSICRAQFSAEKKNTYHTIIIHCITVRGLYSLALVKIPYIKVFWFYVFLSFTGCCR